MAKWTSNLEFMASSFDEIMLGGIPDDLRARDRARLDLEMRERRDRERREDDRERERRDRYERGRRECQRASPNDWRTEYLNEPSYQPNPLRGYRPEVVIIDEYATMEDENKNFRAVFWQRYSKKGRGFLKSFINN